MEEHKWGNLNIYVAFVAGKRGHKIKYYSLGGTRHVFKVRSGEPLKITHKR